MMRSAFTIFAYLLISTIPSAIAASGPGGGDSSKLVLAVKAAVLEASRCSVDVDQVDVTITLDGGLYRIEFIERRKRGGGASVAIERSSLKVKEAVCLQ